MEPLDYASFQDAYLSVDGKRHYQWGKAVASQEPLPHPDGSRDLRRYFAMSELASPLRFIHVPSCVYGPFERRHDDGSSQSSDAPLLLLPSFAERLRMKSLRIKLLPQWIKLYASMMLH